MSLVRVVVATAAVALLAVALLVVYGPGYAGYDAAWALVWGAELAAGHAPSYTTPLAPTPHPLATLAAVPASLLGDGGEGVTVAIAFVGFACVVIAAFAIGRALGGTAGGVLAAALVAACSDVGREAAFASLDLPFLALVFAAVALEVRAPRASMVPLVLLAVAGLLRPEAWPLAVVEAVWLAAAGLPRAPLVAGALAAPLLWAVTDLLATGDPLHSFTGTRELAQTLDRPRGLGTAVEALPRGLEDLVGGLAAVAGMLAAALLLASPPRRALPLVAVTVLGAAGFLALGALGLPVLFRYLLVPATALLVLAGAGAGTLLAGRPTGRAAVAWRAGAAAVLVLLAIAVPQTAARIDDAREFTRLRGDVHRDLRSLTGTPAFAAAARSCDQIVVPDFRTRPVLLLDVGGSPARTRIGNLPDGSAGLLVTYAEPRAAVAFNLGAPSEAPRQAAPAGAQPVGANGSWRAFAVC
jgi:hypothetical protein